MQGTDRPNPFASLLETGAPPEDLAAVMAAYLDAEILPVSMSGSAGQDSAPILISVIRDENQILPDFLRHYRAAGIEKFVFLDNGSGDGTITYLSEQSDVDLYAVAGSFDWKRKQGWITLLLGLYGSERWFIYADADEHIVFDGIERGVTFQDIVRIMDRQGITRVRGCLVDMYAGTRILDSRYERGSRLMEAYPFFDQTGYLEYPLAEMVAREGGPRRRLFSDSTEGFSPQLSKYPLFRLDAGDIFANPHHIWPYERNFGTACYLGILHFKFLPGFANRIARAIQEASYWENSREYRCYQAALTRSPDLSLYDAVSALYSGPQDLIRSAIVSRMPYDGSM